MPEESKESKAKKLAAARKKLKEYQQRGVTSGANTISSCTYVESSTNSGHVSSNISERSESDLQLNGSVNEINHTDNTTEIETTAEAEKKEYIQLEKVNYFNPEQLLEMTEPSKADDNGKPAAYAEDTVVEGAQNINAIQVLITEKSQLTSELNKFRTLCREKDLEIEELNVQYTNATKRVDDLTQRLVDIQKHQEQQKLLNAELQHKMSQARAQQEDHSSHIKEVQQQLALRDERLKRLETDFKDKSNELELSQLRVRQLSDENNITKDNRVETLTQTQFMYEQQIRDLQAMVQQLTQDKEQANTQYQMYVQQLNTQVQRLNERNNELTDEATKLQEREKQWVDHIQQLEKEIQKNISKQAEVKEEKDKQHFKEVATEQLQSLQERINDFESERYEFQLKVKSQEDRLNSLQYELKQKDVELEQLKEHLENISSEQPDKIKLLATMESDKIAASRALTQNIELKKQLDELELRFVQLTNDKADLMNRLDSQQYTNREMHTNYAAMEERLRTFDERFKFKDDEMIRLSHENEELKKKLENKNVFHDNESGKGIDRNDQYQHEHHQNHDEYAEHSHHHHHDYNESHEHNHNDEHDRIHDEYSQCDLKHTIHTENNVSNDQDDCQEAIEKPPSTELQTAEINETQTKCEAPYMATEEAVEKLQQRFTQLMIQCADLTEEKQRLEHLVMQLQSETETIGEYIALYQTQRRILKQREYEKAAQTALLQAEREQMHERLTMLNNLVNSLGVELPQNQHLKQQINEALAQNVALDITTQCHEGIGQVSSKQNSTHLATESFPKPAKYLNSPESHQILHKIQDIITEIKENTKELPTLDLSVDHLNCCLGKFEVV